MSEVAHSEAAQDAGQRIEELRRFFGPRLSIVGHHYQLDSVIRHCDIRGDSLELARKVADLDSEYIVFCGVFFMAESAALLQRPGQKVYLPATDADCAMARMAPAPLLRSVLDKLDALGLGCTPLTYVNSSLAIKTVVGAAGGAVCTSANAERMLRWAFRQNLSKAGNEEGRVLFLPDKNLGNNVGDMLGIAPEKRLVLDLADKGEHLDPERLAAASLLLWPGLCPIHELFTVDQIASLREEYPGIKVAVHPECPPAVVKASDVSGSTSFLIKYAADAPDGSTLAIGTEINLVRRLADEHAGRIKIIPLKVSACHDMAKTTEARLLAVLEAVRASEEGGKDQAGEAERCLITVDQALAAPARLSLTRMLDECAAR